MWRVKWSFTSGAELMVKGCHSCEEILINFVRNISWLIVSLPRDPDKDPVTRAEGKVERPLYDEVGHFRRKNNSLLYEGPSSPQIAVDQPEDHLAQPNDSYREEPHIELGSVEDQ